jgi:hypothetical protein
MQYMICKTGDEPLFVMEADEPPSLIAMAEATAGMYGYESVDALALDHPGLWLGWFLLH